MLLPTHPYRQHPRRFTAAFVLFILVALPVAALPPGLFGGDGGECVMACSLADRECCCKKSADRSSSGLDPHDASPATLSLPDLLCSELCATFNEARAGQKITPIEARARLKAAGASGRVAASLAFGRRAGHDDLSTLPRPPPAPVLRF